MAHGIDRQRRAIALGGGLLSLFAGAGSSGAATELGASVDIDAERAAVTQAEKDFFAALTSGDVEQVVRLLDQSIILLTRYSDPANPTQPLHAEGVAVARTLNERFLTRARNLVASIEPTNVVVAQSADLAYVVGDFEFRFELVGYGRMSVRGRNLHIFKKVDGQWKVAVEATVDAVTEKSN